MKQLVLIVVGLILAQGQVVKLQDCGFSNKTIQFTETADLFMFNGNKQLEFSVEANLLSKFEIDHLRIGIYGDAPDYNYENWGKVIEYWDLDDSGYFTLQDWADFSGLEITSQKVQIQVYDSEYRIAGCAAFFMVPEVTTLNDCGGDQAMSFADTVAYYPLETSLFYVQADVYRFIFSTFYQVEVYSVQPGNETLIYESTTPTRLIPNTQLIINELIDLSDLEKGATYKVKIDVFDGRSHSIGCAVYYGNQDQLQIRE